MHGYGGRFDKAVGPAALYHYSAFSRLFICMRGYHRSRFDQFVDHIGCLCRAGSEGVPDVYYRKLRTIVPAHNQILLSRYAGIT
jgi:hypothetical protein